MANDTFTTLLNTISSNTLGPRDSSGFDMQEALSKELYRSTAEIGLSSLSKMIAADFIKTRSIDEIRKEIKARTIKGGRGLSIEELYLRSFYKLNLELIWNVYTLIANVESTYSKKLFSPVFKDPYSTLIINAAFEIATRCLGISFNGRDTELDFRTLIGAEPTANTDVVIGISKLLKEANVTIVNRTIILAMLPFMTLYKTENVISVMTVKSYCELLRKYARWDCSHSDRIIFNKLASTLEAKLYHNSALIRMFPRDDLRYNLLSIGFSTIHPSIPELERNIDKLTLSSSFNDSEESTEVTVNLADYKANIFTRCVYSTIDWVWRLRMGWNHELAVGSENTWIYTKMFSSDMREFGTSFRYLKNRYLLETIGQSFIGYESTAYDAKCKRLRKLAGSLFDLMHMANNGDYEELCSAYILKRYYTSLELDDIDLYAFINTLEIVMRETDLFTLHHLMTAFIFYSKYLLKDHALENINVNSNITFNDIELWINYD